jgi:hypothetical protein
MKSVAYKRGTEKEFYCDLEDASPVIVLCYSDRKKNATPKQQAHFSHVSLTAARRTKGTPQQ